MRSFAGVVFTATFVAFYPLPDSPASGQTAPSGVDEYIRWLDDPSRQWLATAHLRQMPDAAIPRLLEPGRVVFAPHGQLSAPLLALAKIGEPAIPAIEARVRAIAQDGQVRGYPELPVLIHVLGTIGPSAIPALVSICEIGDGLYTYQTLNAIVEMEPESRIHGQVVSPWLVWRPADDRLDRLERALAPQLPRIERALDRGLRQWDGESSPGALPAAYLLARWGDPGQRARGLEVLEHLARSAKFFYLSIEVIRRLHPLAAPRTIELIQLTVPRVPERDELRAAYLLSMAIGTQRLGGRNYGSLVDEAIRTGRPVDRFDAANFLGTTQDLSNVPRLIAMLDDRTEWSGRAVHKVALGALEQLTLEDLGPDPEKWREWFASVRNISHSTLVERWVEAKRKLLKDVPIWEANRWIARLAATHDPSVLPLVTDYLRRDDLHASKTGPNESSGSGGGGPRGMHGPAVVTLLLGMVQEGIPGALAAVESCLQAADPEVQRFGALALAAYQPRLAADHIARDLSSSEAWRRGLAGEMLLELGDARGLPARIDNLELGSAVYGDVGSQAVETSRGVRMFACQDLRVYSQQPLPCDPNATGADLARQVAAWRGWWEGSGSKSPLRVREARLDLQVQHQVMHVTIGDRVAR